MDYRSGVPRSRPRSWPTRAFSNVLRLSAWYLILTVIFRCPATPDALDESSPRACAAYFSTRDTLVPYYDSYVSPYVEPLRPYYTSLHANVYTPAASAYGVHARPYVARAQAIGQRQWESLFKPQLDQASARATELYDASLAPHVATVHGALKPHIDTAVQLSRSQYESMVLPAYAAAQPYAQQAFEQGYTFTTEVGLPYASWAANNAVVFVRRRVWPPIRVLYGENIQPQLAKIQERLSSYKDGKRLETVVEVADADLARSSLSVESSRSSAASQSSTASTSVAPSVAAESKVARQIEDYAGELKAWKEKFARAAERGAHDLRNRITDITDKQLEEQVKGTGEFLLTSLDEVTTTVLERLKGNVVSIIHDIPLDEDEAPVDEGIEAAKEKTHQSIRDTGKTIREAAQRVRGWRQKFNKDTEDLVNSATESTLEVVNNIRDLGLQEIGMRWATLDGVSYKDWSEYHELRKTFADWRKTVQDVVDEHQGPKLANTAGEDIESRGMVIAENAARELARLKDVAMWKVEAHDRGDDFSTRYSPPGVARAAKQAKQKVLSASSDYIAEPSSSTGAAESVASAASSVASSAASAASSGASSIADAMAGEAESQSSSGSKAASSATSDASSRSSRASKSLSSSAQSASSVASSKVSSKSSSASKALPKSSSSLASSAASSASSLGSSVADGASAVASSASSGLSSALSDASSVVAAQGSDAVSVASSAAAAVVSSASSSYESAQSSKARESTKSRLRSSASQAVSGASEKVSSGVSAASSVASKAAEKAEL